jgi:hypothetical protein
MVGKKLMIGPALTLHAGWQVVPLDATRNYGPKKMWVVASTAADVTLSTNGTDAFVLKSGYTLEVDLDGAPFLTTRSADLVSNGNFTTATGNNWWNYKAAGAATGWTISGGSAHHHAGEAAACSFGQTLSVVDDSIYEVKYSVVKWGTAATGKLGVSLAGVTLSATGPTGIKDRTECITAANSTGPIRFKPGTTGFHGSLDNVSVKKITGSQLLFAKANTGVILQVMFTI